MAFAGSRGITNVDIVRSGQTEGGMVRRQTLKKIGGSVVTVLPKSMLDRFHLAAGDEVYVVKTPDGVLITPFDPDFAAAMMAYGRGARKYRNALRQLAR
jgi:antitoxin MazE